MRGSLALARRALSPNGDALRLERREGDSGGGAEGKTRGERKKERERDVDVLLFVDIHILLMYFLSGLLLVDFASPSGRRWFDFLIARLRPLYEACASILRRSCGYIVS